MASVQETRLEVAQGWRQRLDLGAYRYAEATRLAQTNSQTIAAWQKLIKADRAQVGPEAVERVKLLSYLQLLELALVVRFRRSGVRLADLAQLHRALARREVLRDGIDPVSRHPFVLRSFKRDGPSFCAQADSTLRRAVQHGQHGVAWSPLVGEFFEQVEYDEWLIVRWYPRGRERGVMIDPQLSFGAPVVLGTGLPTHILLERRRAGESLADIADDFGLTVAQVNDALSFEHDLVARAA
jgi:uncharacterized protein (DUF433 family)